MKVSDQICIGDESLAELNEIEARQEERVHILRQNRNGDSSHVGLRAMTWNQRLELGCLIRELAGDVE